MLVRALQKENVLEAIEVIEAGRLMLVRALQP